MRMFHILSIWRGENLQQEPLFARQQTCRWKVAGRRSRIWKRWNKRRPLPARRAEQEPMVKAQSDSLRGLVQLWKDTGNRVSSFSQCQHRLSRISFLRLTRYQLWGDHISNTCPLTTLFPLFAGASLSTWQQAYLPFLS